MKLAFAAALAQTLLFASTALAQDILPSYRARLLGVYDGNTGDPIEGAEVIDVLEKTTALTTKTGTVTLAFLPDGGGMIRIRKIGYNTATMVVAISPADTIPLTIVLSPSATQLAKVVTTDSAPTYTSPGLRDFDERRRAGNGGRFITEAELRKSDSKTMPNTLRTLPGLQIKCPASGPRISQCYAVSFRMQTKKALTRTPEECEVVIYVDGARIPDNDLTKMQVSEFAGVEFYAGSGVPAKYNVTDGACGVLLLWSRER